MILLAPRRGGGRLLTNWIVMCSTHGRNDPSRPRVGDDVGIRASGVPGVGTDRWRANGTVPDIRAAGSTSDSMKRSPSGGLDTYAGVGVTDGSCGTGRE